MKPSNLFLHNKVYLILLGGVVLVLLLLNMAGVLPAKADLFSSGIEAITNPQKAAIFGAERLLLSQPPNQLRFMPVIVR